MEQIKEALLQAHTAKPDYINGSDEDKNKLLKTLLWNASVADKKVLSYKFKHHFQVIAEAPKNADLNTWLGWPPFASLRHDHY